MITIRNLKFAYKKNRQILNIDTLQFPKCGRVGIIGENGAGKTTLGRCLCGLEKTAVR
ncbi:MAG: ATP-binding cassette domain-containing protein [Lachnospiraceae bacterium]|nr:ATP-binding cassette domain-containing protein [Lachnospiraceae bacterium]